MRKTIARIALPLVAAAITGSSASGCSLGGDDDVAADKAGGSKAPVVLRLAYSYKPDEQLDEPMMRYFAKRVTELSGGDLQVKLFFNVAGDEVPDIEARVAGMVRSGRFDLGWIATRAWDQVDVKSFQALQAPFLVTSYGLLGKIATGPMADQMLAGLRRTQLTGLAIVPEFLRHPVGRTRALVSPADFAGTRIRDIPSHASDALLSALGATPVHLSNSATGAERGELDGEEISLPRARGRWTATANVVFFGKANTIFANSRALSGLTPEQRATLRMAAAQTVRHVVAEAPSERTLARRFCSAGYLAFATPAQAAELRRATRPVYDRLERDPETRLLIARIRTVKRSLPVSRTAAPRPCRDVKRTRIATGPARSPHALNGTYRWRLTKAGAVRVGDPNDPDIGDLMTVSMRDGKWKSGPASGTYSVTGDRLRFAWRGEGLVMPFTFTRESDGTLHLKPVLPMDRGDQFNWSSSPWRRIGPPVDR